MSTVSSLRKPRDSKTTSSKQIVLREARRLHRAAVSDSPAAALPVLRRLLAAQIVPANTLPNLFRTRSTIQRKHILRALAVEAGYPSWESYSQALPRVDVLQLRRTLQVQSSAPILKLWFASEAEATEFAAKHGGQAIRIANQAVVLPVAQRSAGDV